MAILRSTVPAVGSFILAILLSLVAGPSRSAVALRAPAAPSAACTHSYSFKTAGPLIDGTQTGPDGGQVPIDPAAPPTSAPELPGPTTGQVRKIDYNGNDQVGTEESEASASGFGRHGGYSLGAPVLIDFVHKELNRTDGGNNQCCHNVSNHIFARASVSVLLTLPNKPNDVAAGVAISTVKGSYIPDCEGSSTSKQVSSAVVAGFTRTVLGKLRGKGVAIEQDENGKVTRTVYEGPSLLLGGAIDSNNPTSVDVPKMGVQTKVTGDYNAACEVILVISPSDGESSVIAFARLHKLNLKDTDCGQGYEKEN
jgi:hypothetical protein